MSTNFQTFLTALKSTEYPVYRDVAEKKAKYPYVVYSFMNKSKQAASSKVFVRFPKYQVSLFTAGTEADLAPLEEAFEDARILYGDFTGIAGDENDDTITNFFCEVKVVESIE